MLPICPSAWCLIDLLRNFAGFALSPQSNLASLPLGLDVIRLLGISLKGQRLVAKVLADLRRRLDPLARKTSPLSVPPPRKTHSGPPLCEGDHRQVTRLVSADQ